MKISNNCYTKQYNVNTSENNNQIFRENMKKTKIRNKPSFSTLLQTLCKTAEREEEISSPGCSTHYDMSPVEIKESLLSAFQFLKNSTVSPPENKSKIGSHHVRIGNCLTVYSNLDVAPIQKPFRKTCSEELPIYIKNIMNTDPSLGHLLKYGCISISPVKDTSKDSRGKSDEQQCGSIRSDSFSGGCAGKLLKLKKEVSKTATNNITDETILDVRKLFPEIFFATSGQQSKKFKPSHQLYSSYPRQITISNELEISSTTSEDSNYGDVINPIDLLEVCIQEEDAKESCRVTSNTNENRCNICKKGFATPMEMYFHVLTHSNSKNINDCNNAVTVTRVNQSTKICGPRVQKLTSILKEINFNEPKFTGNGLEAEPNTMHFHLPEQYISVQENSTKDQSGLKAFKKSKYFHAKYDRGLIKKIIRKSTYRTRINSNIKVRVRRAIYILNRNHIVIK